MGESSFQVPLAGLYFNKKTYNFLLAKVNLIKTRLSNLPQNIKHVLIYSKQNFEKEV